MSKRQNSIQFMALEIAKVANEVSNVLGTKVTVDQVVKISNILEGVNSPSPSNPVATMTKPKVVKSKASSPRGKGLDWKKFDFNKYTDGELHTVTAFEVRSLLGVGNRIANKLILRRFVGRLSLWSMKNGGFSVRSHISKDHNSITVQLYLK
jgi:hypothetical protein